MKRLLVVDDDRAASKALQWLLDDKVAARIDVESEIVGDGVAGIAVSIVRPGADAVTFRFNYLWAAQAARRA